MKQNEAILLKKFMGQLSDHMANAGCNDESIPDTPENRKLIIDAMTWHNTKYYGEEFDTSDLLIEDGDIWFNDEAVLYYLRHRFCQEHNLPEEDD